MLITQINQTPINNNQQQSTSINNNQQSTKFKRISPKSSATKITTTILHQLFDTPIQTVCVVLYRAGVGVCVYTINTINNRTRATINDQVSTNQASTNQVSTNQVSTTNYQRSTINNWCLPTNTPLYCNAIKYNLNETTLEF